MGARGQMEEPRGPDPAPGRALGTPALDYRADQASQCTRVVLVPWILPEVKESKRKQYLYITFRCNTRDAGSISNLGGDTKPFCKAKGAIPENKTGTSLFIAKSWGGDMPPVPPVPMSLCNSNF